MRTVILGKVIENVYDVDYKWTQIKDEEGEMKTVYTDKPVVVKKEGIKEWKELCSYDGRPMYNSKLAAIAYFSLGHTINISENEEVMIDSEIFRADKCEMQLRTNKVVDTIETNKDVAEAICNEQIKAFNKMMIESNEQLKAYCDLHKLVYEETDCIDLFKLVFPNKRYEIIDGVMKVREKNDGFYISTADFKDSWATITGLTSSGNIGVSISSSI